jgi:hypothetical protein
MIKSNTSLIVTWGMKYIYTKQSVSKHLSRNHFQFWVRCPGCGTHKTEGILPVCSWTKTDTSFSVPNGCGLSGTKTVVPVDEKGYTLFPPERLGINRGQNLSGSVFHHPLVVFKLVKLPRRTEPQTQLQDVSNLWNIWSQNWLSVASAPTPIYKIFWRSLSNTSVWGKTVQKLTYLSA